MNLAIALVEAGHEVNFFIYHLDNQFYFPTLESYDIPVHTACEQGSGFSFRVLQQLRALASRENYDGVVSSMHAPSIYAALAMLGLSKPLVVCEESSSNAPVSFFKKLAFYLASLSATSVVANSFSETKNIKKLPGLSKKAHTILNGIRIPRFLDGNPIVKNQYMELLVVGRIAYPKNGVNFLKALSLFHKRNGWTPIVRWAGRKDTDKRSVKMQEEMNDYLLNNPELSSSLVWLGEVENIGKFYRSSDALILTSIYEGFPMVICEAMAEGCFIIASSVCDHPYIIGNEERGLLCDPFSPESICNSIERLGKMSLPEKEKIIQEARKFAELNFSQDSMANAYEVLLSSKNS